MPRQGGPSRVYIQGVKAEATVDTGMVKARVKEGVVMRARVGARLIEVHVKAGAAT